MIKDIKYLKDGSAIVKKTTACGPSEVLISERGICSNCERHSFIRKKKGKKYLCLNCFNIYIL